MFNPSTLALELELSKIYMAENSSDLSHSFDEAVHTLATQLEQGKISEKYFSGACAMASLMKADMDRELAKEAYSLV